MFEKIWDLGGPRLYHVWRKDQLKREIQLSLSLSFSFSVDAPTLFAELRAISRKDPDIIKRMIILQQTAGSCLSRWNSNFMSVS